MFNVAASMSTVKLEFGLDFVVTLINRIVISMPTGQEARKCRPQLSREITYMKCGISELRENIAITK